MITKFGLKIGIIIWILIAAVILIFNPGERAGARGINIWEIFQKAFNIILLIDIIFYYTGSNIKEFFKKRELNVKSEIQLAVSARKELEAKIKETKEKLDNLSVEIDAILSRAKKEAEDEKRAIIQKAKEEADKIVAMTKREIEMQYKLASRKLKSQVAELALAKGEEILRKTIKPEDTRNLIDGYIKQLEKYNR